MRNKAKETEVSPSRKKSNNLDIRLLVLVQSKRRFDTSKKDVIEEGSQHKRKEQPIATEIDEELAIAAFAGDVDECRRCSSVERTPTLRRLMVQSFIKQRDRQC
jgi:hypothetical protein